MMAKLLNKLKLFCTKIIHNKLFYYSILLLFILVYVSPLLFYYIEGDDTVFHLQNIYLYSKTSIFAKIFPEYANNLGWGVGIFYPPLPHAVCGLILKVISKFGFSAIFSIKIFKILIVFFSGSFMYLLSLKLYNSRKNAMISSMIYISSSYFLVNMYMRDALNESMMFALIPLVFLSFVYLFKEHNVKRFYLCFILGYVGMIYSHLVLTLYFTILIIPFLLIHIKNIFNKLNLKHLIIASLVVLVLTSTFTLPLLEHMSRGFWNIPTYKNIWTLPFWNYFKPSYYKTSNNGLLFINIHPLVIILFILSIYNIFKKSNKFQKKFSGGVVLFTILSMLLTSFSLIYSIIPEFFRNIQFAWRLSLFSTFGMSLLATDGINNLYCLFKDKYKFIFTILLVFCFSTFAYNNVSKVKFQNSVPFSLKFDINKNNRDYLPQNAKKNLKYISNIDSNKINILNGHSNIKILYNNVPNMKFNVTDLQGKLKVQIPRMYYLGYTITDSNGKKIDYSYGKHGLIVLTIDRNGIYTVKYTGTKIYQIMSILQKIVLVICFIAIIKWLLIILKKQF